MARYVHGLSEEDARAIAKRNAHWDHVPRAYHDRDGDEDPHDLLNELDEQERRDAKAFRNGKMQKCCVGLAIEVEEAEEAEARLTRKRGQLHLHA